MRTLPVRWKPLALLLFPIALAGGLVRLKAARDRGYAPFQNVIVPKSFPIGQTASALAFSPDSRELAVADTQGQLWLWNMNQRKFRSHFSHQSGDNAKSLSWGTNQLLPVGSNDSIHVYKVPKGTLRAQIPIARKKFSVQEYFDHYSQWVTSAHATIAAQAQVHGAISVWDIGTCRRQFALKAPDRETCGVALSPDDATLAIASLLVKPDDSSAMSPSSAFATLARTEICLRASRTGKVRRILRWDDAGIERFINYDGNLGHMGLAFSPDSKRLAAASINGVRIWEVESGQLLHTIQDRNSPRWAGRKWLAFSPDGVLLAGVGWGENIFVWSARNGQLLQQFRGPDYVSSLAFSPNGRWLATGGQGKGGQGITKIWDVKDLS